MLLLSPRVIYLIRPCKRLGLDSQEYSRPSQVSHQSVVSDAQILFAERPRGDGLVLLPT